MIKPGLLAAFFMGLLLSAPQAARSQGPAQGDGPGIGIAVGQKAPAFDLRDQFGKKQTLESLQGRNGTVLLFFRSADW